MRSIVQRLVVGAVLCAACSGDDGRSASPAVVATAGPTVELSVDGVRVATVRAGALTDGRVPLRTLLPEAARDRARWTLLDGRAGERRLAIAAVADKYPQHEVWLYVDDEQRLCLGLFREPSDTAPRHVRARLGEPQLSLVGVERVELRTAPLPVVEPPPALELAVVGGASRMVSREQLARLPRVGPSSPPGGRAPSSRSGSRRDRAGGWRVRDVVGSVVELAQVRGVRVYGAGDERVELTAAELDESDTAPLLTENRRGTLSLKLLQPDAVRPRARLRDVRRLEVELLAPPAGPGRPPDQPTK